MAGFFGFMDYTKPGKGVDANAPQKHAIFQFFELYWRKFSKLIFINIIYFILLAPIITYLYTISISFIVEWLHIEVTDISTVMFQLLFTMATSMPQWLRIFLIVLSLVLYGPATAGMTFMLRSYAREEHAWMTDFYHRAKANFKQSVFFGLFDAVIFLLFRFNLTFIMQGLFSGQSVGLPMTVLKILAFVTAFAFVIYAFMRNYFFMLLITFDLSIRNILKNSLIFAFVGLWRNLLVTVLSIVTGLLIFFTHPLVEMIMLPFFALSLWGFISVFTCYPVVKKYMIDPLDAPKPEDGKLESQE